MNKEVGKMLEFYHVKHHQSSPYYPQGSRQAKATNKTFISIINKISQEYNRGRMTHLLDALWAYQSSPKSSMGFSPFSLVYWTKAVSLAKVMISSLRVMQMQKKEKEKGGLYGRKVREPRGMG